MPPALASRMLFTMLNPHPLIRSGTTGVRRLVHERGGATAVEFALVALPFLSLLAAILQIVLMVWTARNLDDALQRAGRTIYTGQFQKANSGQTDASTLLSKMKTAMCGASSAPIATVFDCNTLKINVALSNSFASGAVPTPLDSKTGDWAKGFGTNYACAQPGAIVVVTAAVKFRVVFSFLYAGWPGFSDGARLLQSTAVFRTEPYDTSSSPGC